MIRAQNISLAFREQPIFNEFSFALQPNDKVGLVGRNGSGKSTLLKVLASQHQLDEGFIETSSGFTIAYMPQEVIFSSTKNVYDETFEAFAAIVESQKEALAIEKLFDDGKTEVTAELLTRYSVLQEKLMNQNISSAQTETMRVLKGLGFNDNQLDQPVSELSVGWKMRLVLAKLLLQDADFYLFDEPTNHLDIFAKEWFLQFLKNSDRGFLIVCHERYFLDQLCTTILELDQGKGRMFKGNYSSYEKQKTEQKEQTLSAYTRQQKEIEQKKATIERFRASATKARMAQSMIKSLDKIDVIKIESESRTVKFSFKDIKQSGREVLKVDNLAQSFEDKKIFEKVSFRIEKAEKIAVIAANGVGKTTLFNTIIDKYQPKSGTVSFGYNVEHAVFDQDQLLVLDMNKTILQEIEEAAPHQSTQVIRSTLGAFLFGNNDISKKIGVLSGGERSRVSMVRVLLRNPNFMLLDEPTNHLDIQSKEVLLQALKDYTGTLLFVSHDYDFINQLSSRVLELTATGVHSYQGNYESYIEQKKASQKPEDVVVPQTMGSNLNKTAAATPSKAKEAVASKTRSNKELYEWKKAGSRLESKVERTQKEIAELTAELEKETFGSDAHTQKYQRIVELEKKYKTAYAEWDAHQKTF